MRTMVLYASKTGHTRAVAAYIAGRLGAQLIDLKKDKSPDIAAYDRIVIGSGVYAGNISKKVKRFIDEQKAELPSKDVHMFLTCMYDCEKGDRQIEKITEDMSFLRSKAYFTGVGKDDPSANNGVEGFTMMLIEQ